MVIDWNSMKTKTPIKRTTKSKAKDRKSKQQKEKKSKMEGLASKKERWQPPQ